MKKIIIIALMFTLSGTTVMAQSTGNQNSSNGLSADEAGQIKQMEKEAVQDYQIGNETGEAIRQREQETNQNQSEQTEALLQKRILETERLRTAREIITTAEEESEAQQVEKVQQIVQQKRNEVAATVHSLIELEDALGGIGQQVSQVASEFNNSVQTATQAEEKIKSRNGFLRFFIGNDQEALKEMERETDKNQERIQQMLQLKEECDCGEEVKNFFQERVENLKQEQNRLEETIQEEKKTKGIFGWLFGWLEK